MAKFTKTQRDEAIERLRKWLPVGSTVYSIVRKVSASGMRRKIQFVYFENGDGATCANDRHPTYSIAQALGLSVSREGGNDTVTVQGTGMDMCFATVYDLAVVLHGDGNALKSRTL
ncbi:hypothetical protein HYPP_02647 [Hyphomicrobium sp. ghe19]|nr:hypothetical protein HYPP_02647 [Hyphomicrobium sp. ghe19]